MAELVGRDADAVHGPPAFAGAPDAASLASAHGLAPAAAPPVLPNPPAYAPPVILAPPVVPPAVQPPVFIAPPVVQPVIPVVPPPFVPVAPPIVMPQVVPVPVPIVPQVVPVPPMAAHMGAPIAPTPVAQTPCAAAASSMPEFSAAPAPIEYVWAPPPEPEAVGGAFTQQPALSVAQPPLRAVEVIPSVVEVAAVVVPHNMNAEVEKRKRKVRLGLGLRVGLGLRARARARAQG